MTYTQAFLYRTMLKGHRPRRNVLGWHINGSSYILNQEIQRFLDRYALRF